MSPVFKYLFSPALLSFQICVVMLLTPAPPHVLHANNLSTVDDSPFIVKLAARMLTASGHTVESAPNGSAGLARLTTVFGTPSDFDVVLCDFQMPVRCVTICE